MNGCSKLRELSAGMLEIMNDREIRRMELVLAESVHTEDVIEAFSGPHMAQMVIGLALLTLHGSTGPVPVSHYQKQPSLC